MDTTQKDQPNQPQVSVPVGRAEGPPVVVETQKARVEDYLKSSDVEPQIPQEASDYVQPVPTQPKLDSHAQAVGVRDSIPHGAVFANLPTDPAKIEQDLNEPPQNANRWRALIAKKIQEASEHLNNILSPKKPQEVS